jgi:putative transposase
VPADILPHTGRESDIDVGLKVFLITTDGLVVENPRHHRTAEKQVAKAQRRVSRRKLGSYRRREAVQLLRPVRHERSGMPHTSPENPPLQGVGSVKA